MNELLLTNIFFMITSAAVIAVTIGIGVLLWYLIPIVRDARDVVRRLRKAGESVEKDFESLRENLKEEGTKGKMIVDAALGFIARKVGVRSKKISKKD